VVFYGNTVRKVLCEVVFHGALDGDVQQPGAALVNNNMGRGGIMCRALGLSVFLVLLAAAPVAALDITFCASDLSYCSCDGLQFYEDVGLNGDILVMAVQTGCAPSDPIIGTKGRRRLSLNTWTGGLYTVIRSDGTWTHYNLDDGSEQASGRWIVGYPTAGGVASR
jgi:hypothetical protein